MQAGAEMPSPAGPEADGRASWMRLLLALALATIGGVGMWCVVVALPAVQAEFGVDRGTASLPYALLTLGIAVGGMLLGRWSDRYGVMPVVDRRCRAARARASSRPRFRRTSSSSRSSTAS